MGRPILLEAKYRNGLERGVAQQLEAGGVQFFYETNWLPYAVPARKAKYLPDFSISDTPIILETKGWFGRNGAKERQKLVLLKEQYPDLDFRLVFSDARKPIYKGSKTTYADWARDNGFKFADRGKVPPAWIEEIKKQQRR